MEVISIIGAKGGLGKTCLAVNMANYLSNCGISTLLVDCDFNTNGATNFMELNGLEVNTQSAFKSLEVLGLEEFRQKNQLFGLADYGTLNYVNPNYFGKVAEHKKNEQTTFFITSSPKRDYTPLISAANRLATQGAKVAV